MSMPCSITGDLSIGHAGFTPAPITAVGAVTARVLVMGVPPHVAMDIIAPHVLGLSAHPGLVQDVSTTVTAGGLGLARMMDKGDCGALLLGTAATVLVGG
jgi:uncharacterized Zn-binding protein involved in type VI secretion